MTVSRPVLIAVTLLVAALLAGGCQSQNLAVCKEENIKLTNKLADAEIDLAGYKSLLEAMSEQMGQLTDEATAYQDKIAALQRENDGLRLKLLTPAQGRHLIEGVEEIRRLQREAGARLTAQQAADANKPK